MSNKNIENNSNSFLSVQNLTTAFEFDNKLHLASKDVSFDIKKGRLERPFFMVYPISELFFFEGTSQR